MTLHIARPTCTTCGGPLVCQPTQTAWEIAHRICQRCHEAFNLWELLASAHAPHREEVRH